MNKGILLSNLGIITNAPNGINQLRSLILGLAINGKLVEQRTSDGTGSELVETILKTRNIENIPVKAANKDLPKSWAQARLGELLYLEMGQSPNSDSYNLRGEGLPFYQGKTDFGAFVPTPRVWCSSPTKIAKAGDVLLSVRAPVGPTNYVEEESCIGRGLAALRPLEGMKTDFILWWLRAYESQIAEMGTGTTFVAVSKKNLEPFVINVPPLAEQNRIVETINEMMNLCDELEIKVKEASELSEKFVRSVVASILT